MVLKISGIILLLMAALVTEGCGQSVDADFQTWVRQFAVEAEAEGISRSTVDIALKDIRFLPGVIEADQRQPEFKKTLAAYVAERLTAQRIVEGRRMLNENRRLLRQITRRYGVQPHYLVALWGIETSYGRHTGKVPTLSALATLAFEGRRGRYFRQELLNVLRILESGKLTKEQLFGSWAGALGNLQFMPSTFLSYAVDGDADGKIDLWNTRADFLASAANYLQQAGWQPRQKWGREITLPSNLDAAQIGLAVQAPLDRWQALGVRLRSGQDLPKATFPASLVIPDGRAGDGFLVYENYRVLMKWNKAHSFAVTVGLLADRIAKND